MLKESQNIVIIEGILSEINLKYGKFTKNGVEQNTVGGTITVRVNQELNGDMTTLEIPIHMFATELTKNNTTNPAYKSIEKVMNEFVSIAASDIEHASRVRMKASIQMNEYWGKKGLVSFPRISTSFINEIAANDCHDEATFTATFVIGSIKKETSADGVETGRLEVRAMIPQYGGRVDVVPFYAENVGVVNAISQIWTEGDTVTGAGKLKFTSETVIEKTPVDFGEPIEKTYTKNVSDLILTSGTNPLDGDFAINLDEIQEALAKRQATLDEMKAKAESAPKKTTGNFTSKPDNKFSQFGF